MVKFIDQVTNEELSYHINPKLVTSLDKIKENLHHKDQDYVLIVDGTEGCLTGDTEIQISRFKVSRRYTLEKLYNHLNGNPDKIIPKNKSFDLSEPIRVRSFNGKEIRLHKIKNVVYSGIKKVYLLKLENGLTIKATADHKFLTSKGWVELSKLNNHSQVMCDTLNSKKSNRKRIKLYDIQLMVGKNHPYVSMTGRVEVHRLIYESRLNNVEFTQFLDILLNEPETCKKFKFINPLKYDIHHKDGCHYNNSIENLELLKKDRHRLEHNNYSNFSQGIPKFSCVKEIKYVGLSKTYDIQCEEPYHNFVANGIVVHNSGKSVFAMQIGKYVDPSLDLNNICMDADEFKNAIKNAKQFQTVIFDETFTGLSSKGALSQINRMLVSLMMQMRQKNLFVIVVLPSFFLLDKYVALFRARCLFHIYQYNKRRCFVGLNHKKKQYIYLTGKKIYSYGKITKKCRYKGNFFNNYVIDEVKYRAKKAKALDNMENITETQPKYLIQRNKVIGILSKQGLTQKEISNYCKEAGFQLEQRAISDILAQNKVALAKSSI